MAKKDLFVDAGLKAARWFVNSQVPLNLPYWDANFGRFIYNRHMPSGATVLGLSWTQGRGLFTLMAAYELTGDTSLLKSMSQGLEYLKTLQIHDSPDDSRRQYVFRENMPQDWLAHVRDATEAALSVLFMYRMTGDKALLQRAVNFSKWFEANGFNANGWPNCTVWLDRMQTKSLPLSFQAGNIPFFYYLAKATDSKKPLKYVKQIADLALQNHVREDGAVIAMGDEGHHTTGEGLVWNDDGLMIGLLCAYESLGQKKYLETVERYARWVVENAKPPLPQFAGLPCVCNTMIQLSDMTGDGQWREWAGEMLARHVLPLQVKAAKDPMSDGAFRGEDEKVKWYGPKKENTPPTEFINTRMTCYAGLACFKMAGIVGPYYGATGWDRKVRKFKLPAIAVD